ncbi:NAD(P)H-binding protein [Oerskovia sp. Sa1BUA8]|uniref:NAD(P)H-binding protein n=1 Tax=Oerskovia douganii TaxID=2762210 RepID=A0A9D5UBC5_9CELL|nr:NAD(P)H-binding protein [Oerskovia douganii]MBE7701760.1 NAD(P)H-binding protein [Oerskovia douganii]
MTAHQPPAETAAPAGPAAPAAPDGVAPLVAVVGATGKSGRRVAARLTAAGVRVRAVSRSTEVRLDWDDPATWATAVAGADAVYVAVAPDLAAPGVPEVVADLAGVAAREGVRRLVLLSGRGEPEAQRAEGLVAEAFPARTVVRCAWFAQNFSESFLLDPVLGGVVHLPVDGVVEPFVDLEDVAEVAVAALTQPGHEGLVHELTGPRLLTFGEALAEIGAASGREVRLRTVTGDEFAAGLRAAGLPADDVDLVRYLFEEVLDGRNAHLAHGVREALGREPRDFAGFARREAAVWSPTSTAAPSALSEVH